MEKLSPGSKQMTWVGCTPRMSLPGPGHSHFQLSRSSLHQAWLSPIPGTTCLVLGGILVWTPAPPLPNMASGINKQTAGMLDTGSEPRTTANWCWALFPTGPRHSHALGRTAARRSPVSSGLSSSGNPRLRALLHNLGKSEPFLVLPGLGTQFPTPKLPPGNTTFHP